MVFGSLISVLLDFGWQGLCFWFVFDVFFTAFGVKVIILQVLSCNSLTHC